MANVRSQQLMPAKSIDESLLQAARWLAAADAILVDEIAFRGVEPLPRCQECAGLAHPNILMFGDWSWLSQRTQQQKSRDNRRTFSSFW